MTNPKPRYWAIRTDRDNRELLLRELQHGRLRQGWGYVDDQDLKLVQAEKARGGAWWERLSEDQEVVLPHLRMLATADDSVQLGDRIVVPNLPEDGKFFIAEVSGQYYFDPLRLSPDADINDLACDYGHVLPVSLITGAINKYADSVDASIRSTLRTPMRMWNLDSYGEVIERLVAQYKDGADLTTALSGEARVASAWEAALAHAESELRSRLSPELNERFQAAEWEEPIKMVLENLYPGSDVRWVGGPQEHGADLIVQIPNHFGGLPWLLIVQVKNYTGEIGPAVLSQLRSAYDRYSQEGKPLSLIVMTTAEEASSELTTGANQLSQEFKVPVEIVLRERMTEIILDGLKTKLI